MYNIGFWSGLWEVLKNVFLFSWGWLIDAAWTFITYVVDAILNILVLPVAVPVRFFEIFAVVNWFFPVMETAIFLGLFLFFLGTFWGIKFVYNTIVGLL